MPVFQWFRRGAGASSSTTPATPALTVTDAGDGTGGTATVSGSTVASTNTLWYAVFSAQGMTWVSAGTRTSDGAIPFTLGVGTCLFIVTSALSGSVSLPSNPALLQVTSNSSGAAMGPDQETAAAIVTKWNVSGTLATLVPGGLHKDRLFPTTLKPYARIECKQAKSPQFSAGGRYIDFREVTLTIWGVGDVKVGLIVPAVQAVFNDKPLTFANNPAVGHMRTEQADVTVSQEDAAKSGDEYRAATFKWIVWTDRRTS